MRSLLSLFLAAGSAGLNPELVVDLTPSTSARPALMQGNLLAAAPVHDETDNWLLGRWTARTPGVEAAAEFMADGTFRQTAATIEAKESHTGRYQQAGQVLNLMPEGQPGMVSFHFRFVDRDTLWLIDAAGQAVTMNRVTTNGRPPRAGPGTEPSQSTEAGRRSSVLPQPLQTNAPAALLPSQVSATAIPPTKLPAMVLEKTWEPNERAFWFLKPKGWLLTGGIFNVNPLEMNGPGNTLSPKNDLTVKNDEAGTVMFRWAPVWYYADLSLAQLGFAGFPLGSYYRGMLVKPLPTPKAFLLELLHSSRPDLRDLSILLEDSMPELIAAYENANRQVNQGLVQMGVRANGYSAAGLLVEYTERGRRYREALITVIVDSRAGAFSWWNERTIVMRAPAAEYETWKPLLDLVRTSDHMNPPWVASANRQIANRTQMVRETDRYINQVANEILQNRRKAHAEMRHEQWLFIGGQEEYKNPFTGEIERDTAAYRHRWVNNQGDIIFTDHNDFDPNEIEEYKTREWKPSAIWNRQR